MDKKAPPKQTRAEKEAKLAAEIDEFLYRSPYTSSLGIATLQKGKKVAQMLERQMGFPPELVNPAAVVAFADMPKGVHGQVRFSTPFMAEIAGNQPIEPTTVSHELEHVGQLAAGTRYNSDLPMEDRYIASVFGAAIEAGIDPQPLIANGKRVANTTRLQQHLEDLAGTDVVYLGRTRANKAGTRAKLPFAGLDEQFAELHAIETITKKDLTKDPIVREEYFMNNPEFVELYKATTGLRATRTDAKDLPPMTVDKTKIPAKEEDITLGNLVDRVIKFFRD